MDAEQPPLDVSSDREDHLKRERTARSFVTAEDVARLAGVSRSAVSRTFTPGASVSADVRHRVQEAARSSGLPSQSPGPEPDQRPVQLGRGRRRQSVSALHGTPARRVEPCASQAWHAMPAPERRRGGAGDHTADRAHPRVPGPGHRGDVRFAALIDHRRVHGQWRAGDHGQSPGRRHRS